MSVPHIINGTLFAITIVRFNLMAVVPDRRIAITHKLKMLKTNQAIVTAALEKLLAHIPSASSAVSLTHPKLDDSIQLDSIKNDESPLNDQQFVAENFHHFALKEEDIKV